MDIVTLGAALNGSAEYVNSHFKGGSNIQIVDNPDGTQTINASGEVSSEDTVARAEIAEIKDGETLDSFGDVETALGDKADTSTTYTKTEVDTALSAKANSADVYSKSDIDTTMSAKADKSTTYTKTEVDVALGNKVDKVQGKGLSTNDFTTVEKAKLDDLAEVKSIGTGLNLDSTTGELTATGGGGGTSDYSDLTNKPQINGNTLSGNKTSAQLGLASASDIPTVPITAIQKNGTGIIPLSGTVNITVPTTAADVSALPSSTKYAAALSLTINSSTFVMTGQLKDQNGDNLGTAQTIDLPLESVVVGGSYDSQTKKVVLTLQNGNTIEFSVADLVSGLQTELSASNKLNPAYINYDSTHRAVSDTEKSTWNGKQNALSAAQLAAVNSGIDSTKVEQIATNASDISDIETALSDKVDKETGKGLSTNDYTTAEKTKLAGIAEGAEVNVQSNWTQTTTTADDYIKNKPTLGTAAAKNATDTYNATGTDVTTGKAVAAALATLPEPMVFKGSLGTGGTITTLPTASSSNKGYVYKVITAGTYASQSAKIGDTFISDGSAWVLIPSGDEPSGTVTNVAVANGGGLTVSGSPITSSGTITVGHSNSVTAKTSSSVKKFTYDKYGHVTGSSELSTAESNALASGIDSTKVAQIETNKNNISKDEAALVELVDSGAKNILDVNTSFTTGTNKGVTYTNNGDQTYTITTGSSGSTADDSFAQLYDVNADNLFGVKKGEKVVISTTSNSVACAIVPKYSGGYGTTIRGYKDRPIEYIIPSNFTGFLLRIGVTTSGTVVDENVGFMICTKAAWDISHEYQPYRPSYQELYEMVKALQANQ